METISILAIARQKSCLQLYVCLDLKYEVSLSLDRGKSWYEIRRVLRRKPKAKVATLRLFRLKNTNTRWHFRIISDYIVVSPPLRLISKKEEGGREEPEILGFGPFSETFSTLKTQTPRRRHLELPKRCWLKTYVRFLISLNKSIELNKIHHYFMCTSFAGRMNY